MIIEESLHTPFEYGSLDCGLLALKHGLERTQDPAVAELLEQLEGNYSTKLGGHRALLRWMRRTGIPTARPYENVLTHFLGEPVNRYQARTGDICLGDWGEGISFGIIEGHRVVCVHEVGLVRLPLHKVEKVWHV